MGRYRRERVPGVMGDGMTNTCRGCKFLYLDGSGYSNYTWLESFARCARSANPALLADHSTPCDWEAQPEGVDIWPPTMAGRCGLYAPGVLITLDPDREDDPREALSDEEQVRAILDDDRKRYPHWWRRYDP